MCCSGLRQGYVYTTAHNCHDEMWRGRPRAEGMSTNGRCHAETPKPSTVSDRNNSQIVYNRFERFFSFVARFSSCILYFCYFRARATSMRTQIVGIIVGKLFLFFCCSVDAAAAATFFWKCSLFMGRGFFPIHSRFCARRTEDREHRTATKCAICTQ